MSFLLNNKVLLVVRFLQIFWFGFLLAACGRIGEKTVPATPTWGSPPTARVTIAPTVTLPSLQGQQVATDTPQPTGQATEMPTPIPVISEPAAQVTTLPDASGFTWRPILSGLVRPVDLTHAGDGSGRLFVVEQAGVIRVVQDGKLLSEPFLDMGDRVGSRGNEQGLLGLAFHPRYAENGFFFVNYTDKNGDTVIARWRVSGVDANRADPGSEKRLLKIPQPYPNHNGGVVAFGPDGYLYLGLGDGGSAGDPQGYAQSLTSLLGKILRIDVDHGEPYAIPPDNPFAQGGGSPEIWAYGLRNPWRFSFDRLTGDLYIGDVGQNLWEEIDFLPGGSPGGANFGWNYWEGNHPYKGVPPADMRTLPPIMEYGRELGCSVTGGVVYRGRRLPAWQGVYLFGDFCSGNVWGLVRDATGEWQQALLFKDVGRISSFGEDEQGEVYLVDLSGKIFALVSKD